MRILSRLWLVCLMVAASAISSPGFAGVNLLTNPGFEDSGGSYNGWFTFGSGTALSLPGGDNIIRTGAAASKMYGQFSGGFNVGGFGQAFTPTVGRDYVLTGYSYVSSGDPIPGADICGGNRLIAKIVFFNQAVGGAELSSNEVIIGDGTSVRDQWNAFTVSAPAPGGALRVEALFLFLQPGMDGGSVFVDDVSFSQGYPLYEPNLLANPSFNGNLAGWSTFGNAYYDGRAWGCRTAGGGAKLFGTFQADAPSGMYQSFFASLMSQWQLNVYAMTTCMEDPITGADDDYAVARIVFRDWVNNEIGSNETVIASSAAPLGTWTRSSVDAVAPPGTDRVEAYILYISPTLTPGNAVWVDDVSFVQVGVTAAPPLPSGAMGVALHQNSPNPFNPLTRIDFDLRDVGYVDLRVYDVAGRWIATLLQHELPAGPHSVTWDGRTADGAPVATGVYSYVLKTPAGELSRRMALIK